MQEIPDFPVIPIHNGIHKAFCCQLAGRKQRIQTFLIISDMYFFIVVGNLLFKDTPALGATDALCSAHPGGEKTPLAVLFFEDSAAISGHAGRRHQLAGNQVPHTRAPTFI